jgi:hypothetical protein
LARFGVFWQGLARVDEGARGEADALEDLVNGLVQAREMGGGDGTA